MFKNILILIAFALSISVSTARAGNINKSVVIESDVSNYVVNTDGTWSMTRDRILLIKNRDAIESVAQQSFYYNHTLQTLDISEAYTEKPDGTRVALEPEQIIEQEEPQSSMVAMFQDIRVKTAIFPNVDVGDRLVMRVREFETTPLYPQQFDTWCRPDGYDIEHLQINFDMPATMPLYADARHFRQLTSSISKGRRLYAFAYEPSDNRGVSDTDQFGFDYTDRGDLLIVSTLRDAAELASAYAARANERATVTPEIKALAEAETRGIDGTRLKVLTLANWVRLHIRYVAAYLGADGVVPHSAARVLAHRYGDCKDHSTLLQSLLTAINVDSSQVLINGTRGYTISKVGTLLGGLNHAIVYVPELDLYIDTTAANVDPGYLPENDLNKPVILVSTGKLSRTPASQIDSETIETDISIGADGKYVSTSKLQALGAAAGRTRALWLKEAPTERVIGVSNPDAAYELVESDIDGMNDTLVALQKSHGALARGADGSLRLSRLAVAPAVSSTAYQEIAKIQPSITLATAPCPSPIDVKDRVNITLPPGLNVLSLPQPIAIHTADHDVTASFQHIAQSITAEIRLQLHHDGTVCTHSDNSANLGSLISAIQLGELEFQQHSE